MLNAMLRAYHDSDDEDDNVFTFVRRNRTFRDRNHPFDCYNDEEIYNKYRFDRASILELTDLLIKDLERDTKRNKSIPPMLQVFGALRYFASNSFQEVIGDTLSVSKATISRVVKAVSFALVKKAQKFIKFPSTADDVRQFKLQFYELANFPNVVGCIDCTHVQIISPGQHSEVYRNRKGFPSINVQAVCGPNGEFTNLVVKWPGSTHDSRIFKESSLCQKLESGQFQGILLGDSGYACRTFLLTPYANPTIPCQKRFNAAQKRTRVLIKQVFGRWKRRFAILHGEIRTKLETTFAIILACGVLHNVAVQHKLKDFDIDFELTDDEHTVTVDFGSLQDGKSYRNHIANNYF